MGVLDTGRFALGDGRVSESEAEAAAVRPEKGGTLPRLSGGLIAIMAVATGAVVANLYYAQPLLHQVAATFDVGTAAVATVVTCTQIGYAAGLVLVVPLGDFHPRRSLVSVVYLIAAVSLVACALSPDLWLFDIGSLAVGCASVAGQLMIPFAADLATPERRGRVIGLIMSGLLTGILLARTASGIVAQAFGWRAIYWISAVLMVGFALVLGRVLPREPDRPHLHYWGLVRSSFGLLASLSELRRRAWLGAGAFACFSVLWTSLAILLSAPPYRYSSAVIGLFGLAGVAGVVAANMAGKLADSSRTPLATATAAAVLTGSFVLLWLGKTSLSALLLGIVALDVGTQGMQITNQAVIYTLAPEARSRINSAYMFCYFVGGAVGSVAAGIVMSKFGWSSVCLLGAGFGVLTIVGAVFDRVQSSLPA